jgi:hypothetical protein
LTFEKKEFSALEGQKIVKFQNSKVEEE